MSYTHADEHNGVDLAVQKVVTERDGTTSVDLAIYNPRTQAVTRTYVINEDAPAVALAILEAAGITDGPGPLCAAFTYLGQHIRENAEAQAREQEDAKVRAFAKTQNPGAAIHDLPTGEIPIGMMERWRRDYHAAREFFTREEVTP